MRHYSLWRVLNVALAAVSVGCDQAHQPISANRPEPALPTPCAIALAPHTGADPVDQEIIRFQEKAQSASDPTPALERLGWAYVAKARSTFDPGFYKLAEQTALCLDSKKPGCAEAMLLRGHVLHSLHKFKEGEAVARELVAKRGLAFDYGLLGDVLMEQGKLDEAVVAYQAMMNQRPSPEAYGRTAHIRWLKGDLNGAIQAMQMAANATSPRDRESAAWIHTRLALYFLQAGRFDDSSRFIEAALLLQPDYAPALLARGRLLLAQDRSVEAVEPLTRAAAGNPLPEYQWLLSEALRAANRLDEARALEARLKQHGEADDPRTFALFLATRGEDVETALRLANRELETRADVFTLDALAWALHAAGKTAEAQAMMRRALAEGTQDARLQFHAAMLLGTPANVRQDLLLPSEKKLLAANPVLIAQRSHFGTTQTQTEEKQQ